MHCAAVGAAVGILAILAGDSDDDPLARHLHAHIPLTGHFLQRTKAANEEPHRLSTPG